MKSVTEERTSVSSSSGYVLNRFFHNLFYHPTSIPKGGLRLGLLSGKRKEVFQSTKQRTAKDGIEDSKELRLSRIGLEALMAVYLDL